MEQLYSGIVLDEKKIELPKVMERLARIAKINLEDFLDVSGGKFENSLQDMFSLIASLEAHLKHFIALNESLKKESTEINRQNKALTDENKRLTAELDEMRDTVPTVEDLEKKIEIAVGETNKYRAMYEGEIEALRTMRASFEKVSASLRTTREELTDASKTIAILERRK